MLKFNEARVWREAKGWESSGPCLSIHVDLCALSRRKIVVIIRISFLSSKLFLIAFIAKSGSVSGSREELRNECFKCFKGILFSRISLELRLIKLSVEEAEERRS